MPPRCSSLRSLLKWAPSIRSDNLIMIHELDKVWHGGRHQQVGLEEWRRGLTVGRSH